VRRPSSLLFQTLPELDFYNATALTATFFVDFRALPEKNLSEDEE
jgi:hypothetical protein